MPDFKLSEISSLRDIFALGSVRVEPEQRRFTKNVMLTYFQTRHPAVTTYGVESAGERIGYVMLIHAENPTQWIIERLTIDSGYQRQGYGFAVVDRLIDMIHGFDNSEMVIARYKPENVAARALFAKLNFVEREEMFRGRHVALLEFEFEEDEEEDEEVSEDAEAPGAPESNVDDGEDD